MIQELSNKVWKNPNFQDAAQRIEAAWLAKEVGATGKAGIEYADASRLIQAAAILACSAEQEHRKAAYRIATYTYEFFGAESLPLNQALRVVLARLGNFPALSTRKDVLEALADLPLMLATDDLSLAREHEAHIGGETYHLTDFQYGLWRNLVDRQRIALSAPTSAGKSFVLQGYLSSLFSSEDAKSVVYLVPTRALIAQVSSDLAAWFSKHKPTPEIVTVPIDAETALPSRAVYVMTQERLHVVLAEHPSFKADEVVVDEAQGIQEGARGILLQTVIDDLLRRNSGVQILFASPSIHNLEIFGRLFDLTDVTHISSIEPTVAQNFFIVDIEAASDGRISIRKGDESDARHEAIAIKTLHQTTASNVDKLVHVSAGLGFGQSNIVYANGAADAELIAIQLAQIFKDREPTRKQLDLAELVSESVHPKYALVECIKKGIAFHYGNIPTQVRRAIEAAVTSGVIDYLVCTSTLLQGVNLPAKNIFMCYPKKGITTPMEATDFWNLAGRAGRLRREFHGNIFLIDYERWRKKPLSGPRHATIASAMGRSIAVQHEDLVDTVLDRSKKRGKAAVYLDATFMRLFSDLKRHSLSATFDKIGLAESAPERSSLSDALQLAQERITLPIETLERSANISAHRQQRLYDRLCERISVGGRAAALALLPKHPREDGAYDSYADILELCHEIILGLDVTREKKLHRFHALMALFWMQGKALPQIIQDQIEFNPDKGARVIIRDTLDVIETQLRFQGVRLFGCYHHLLAHALDDKGYPELKSSISTLPLYLEVGASDRSMVSFISLGLSRVAAAKLNDFVANKRMDVEQVRSWLRTRAFEQLSLSPLLLAEIEALVEE